jgi:coiled-coil domain-containing protein 130
MGVRYNAEKKKIGSYYSTPIFSFRCKCHLCDGWFEIHTDPKVGGSLDVGDSMLMREQNTRYVVAAGARKKDEDWDPEENGGFAIHGIILRLLTDCVMTL